MLTFPVNFATRGGMKQPGYPALSLMLQGWLDAGQRADGGQQLGGTADVHAERLAQAAEGAADLGDALLALAARGRAILGEQIEYGEAEAKWDNRGEDAQPLLQPRVAQVAHAGSVLSQQPLLQRGVELAGEGGEDGGAGCLHRGIALAEAVPLDEHQPAAHSQEVGGDRVAVAGPAQQPLPQPTVNFEAG